MKLKTKKTLIKRIKLSGRGKLLRQKITGGHLRVKFTTNRKYRAAKEATLNTTFEKKLKRMLPGI